jgi:hypothetical protein
MLVKICGFLALYPLFWSQKAHYRKPAKGPAPNTLRLAASPGIEKILRNVPQTAPSLSEPGAHICL